MCSITFYQLRETALVNIKCQGLGISEDAVNPGIKAIPREAGQDQNEVWFSPIRAHRKANGSIIQRFFSIFHKGIRWPSLQDIKRGLGFLSAGSYSSLKVV